MNKSDLYNYIKLCKIYDLNTIKNIYNDLTIKSNDIIYNEYGIPFEYINSMKMLSNNGKEYNVLRDIYNDYHKMIGGKGGKGNIQGTKGSKQPNIKKQGKKYKEIKDESLITKAGVGTAELATGMILSNTPNTTGIISDITILKGRMEEIYKNMLMEFSKNNYVLTTITNDINNINKKIDSIMTQIKKE
jgi:hypothetical protein